MHELNKSFWNDRRVFISGCTGFLGSWLTAGLVENGADVIGLQRDQVPHSHLVRTEMNQKITIVNGDICDYQLIERTLAEYEVDTIFHLAAQTIVGIANRAPQSTFETNIKGTWVLLEAARRNPTVNRIIIASSDKAYGRHEELPYREDAPLQGRHPYDVSKTCADLIAQAYIHSYNMPLVISRFANIYGGGDLNWNRIVPGTIRSVVRGERPIIRSDGTFKRDYLFVGDAVTGYLTLAEQLRALDVCGQSFNFGLDKPVTVFEIVQTIIQLSNFPEIEPIVLDEAKNEIPDQYLSSEKAKRVLGWQPQFTLSEGLKETMNWYESYLQG
jgi:CDP-glucose 4,6-dehydratase